MSIRARSADQLGKRMRPRRRRWEGIAISGTPYPTGTPRAVAVWCTARDERHATLALEQLAGGPVVVMREQVYW